MLGNLTRGLNSLQKRQLYKCYTLPITLYGFQAQYYNKVLLDYPLKILGKLQQSAVLWISDAFCTSLSEGIEAISDLIPIHLHIKKLYNHFHSRRFSLSHNYIIKSILSSDGLSKHNPHSLSFDILTFKQRLHLSSPLIDMDNKKNEFLPSFDPFDQEFSPGNCLIDFFSNRFSFYSWKKSIKIHIKNLDDIVLTASSNYSLAIVISDASIKNHVTMSILHIHMHNKPTIKIIHHAINVTSTEAKLFTICYSINQAIILPQVKKIIVITDSLHAMKRIFDSLIYSYQIHSAVISHKLREFLIESDDNYIEFQDCSSKLNQPFHV